MSSKDEGKRDSTEDQEKEAPLTTGACYRYSNCTGDILANNVTKDDCFKNLGGKSWKGTGTTRCWEN